MKVFKFGGASIQNAAGVKNVAAILHSFPSQQLIIVISAMGKTTNALERVLNLYRTHQGPSLSTNTIKRIPQGHYG